jgi:hypothetical protein
MRREILIATLLAAGATAHANLTVPVNALVANSVQAFSSDAMNAFALESVSVTALGNATAVPDAVDPTTGAPNAFSLPITTITIGPGLKIVKGDARGSALYFSRTYKGAEVGVYLANFRINYGAKQVLADVTIKGSSTTASQQAIYNFDTQTPLGIKYQLPLKITGHEVLDHLYLTEETKTSFMTGLKLPAFVRGVLDAVDFGTLTQDIAVRFRAKPVSMKPYVPAP